MKTPRFSGPFKWTALRQQLLSLREDVQSIEKIAGRHVTIDEHRGKGKVINVASDASRRPSGGATGACCVDTDCSIETADDCAGMGGVWQGADTTCDPNPCVSGGCPDPGCPALSVSASVTFSVDDTESAGCSFHATKTETLFSGETIADVCSAGGGWGPFEFIYPEYDNGQIFINNITVGLSGSQVCINTDGVCGVFYKVDEFGNACGSGYFCFQIGDAYMTGGTACSSGCGGGTTFTWVLDDGMGFTISASLTITIS